MRGRQMVHGDKIFISFDKVNNIKIYKHDGCPEEPVKKGGSKSHTSGQTTVKTTRNHPKTHFSQQNKKKTRENAHRTQENDFF